MECGHASIHPSVDDLLYASFSFFFVFLRVYDGTGRDGTGIEMRHRRNETVFLTPCCATNPSSFRRSTSFCRLPPHLRRHRRHRKKASACLLLLLLLPPLRRMIAEVVVRLSLLPWIRRTRPKKERGSDPISTGDVGNSTARRRATVKTRTDRLTRLGEVPLTRRQRAPEPAAPVPPADARAAKKKKKKKKKVRRRRRQPRSEEACLDPRDAPRNRHRHRGRTKMDD